MSALFILERPQLSHISLDNAMLRENTPVTITCIITQSGYPRIHSVKFYRNGILLADGPQNNYSISSLARQHSGNYSCKVQNKAGHSIVAKILLVACESMNVVVTIKHVAYSHVKYAFWHVFQM